MIVSTHPPERSKWLERGVVERAEREIPLPVTHVVVDLEAEDAAAARSAEPEPPELAALADALEQVVDQALEVLGVSVVPKSSGMMSGRKPWRDLGVRVDDRLLDEGRVLAREHVVEVRAGGRGRPGGLRARGRCRTARRRAPAGASCGGLAPGHAGDAGDVGGDVLGVLPVTSSAGM